MQNRQCDRINVNTFVAIFFRRLLLLSILTFGYVIYAHVIENATMRLLIIKSARKPTACIYLRYTNLSVHMMLKASKHLYRASIQPSCIRMHDPCMKCLLHCTPPSLCLSFSLYFFTPSSFSFDLKDFQLVQINSVQ